MKRKLRARHRASLMGRMALSAVAVIAFVVCIVQINLAQQRRAQREQIDYLYGVLQEDINSSVEATLDNLYNEATTLAYSSSVQGALFAKAPLTSMRMLHEARHTLFTTSYMNDHIINMFIFQPEGRKISLNDSFPKDEIEMAAAITQEDYNIGGNRGYLIPVQINPQRTLCLYVYLFSNALYYSEAENHASGRVCVLLDVKDLFDIGSFQLGDENRVMLTAQGGAYSLADPLTEDDISAMRMEAPGVSEGLRELQPTISYRFDTPLPEWTLYYSLPRNGVITQQESAHSYTFLTFVIALVVIVLIFYNLYYIAASLRMLHNAVREAAVGHRIALDEGGLKEVHYIADEFNQLLGRVDEASMEAMRAQENVYQAMVEKNRLAMAYYKNQINPHFLFNTLECIRSMAWHDQTQALDDVIQLTAQVLQFGLYSPYIVSVGEELQNGRNYFELMNIRAMGAYHYREHIDEGVLEHSMISMVLQPIYENAILHGAKRLKGRQFTLDVRIAAREDELVIAVTDNGHGLSPEMVGQLNAMGVREEPLPSGTGLGVQNIARRLRIMDERSRLTFRSVEGHYTQVTVVIPTDLALQRAMRSVESTGRGGA